MTYEEHYALCLANGCSERLAEMLASRSFPGTKGTDRAFMQGRALDGAQFEGQPDIVGRDYVAKALASGVNPAGKYYLGTLARYPGDPEAWVDSLHDVRRTCEERGWGATGAVDVAAPQYAAVEPPSKYAVAPDLVERYADEAVAERPELAARRPELREELAERLAGRSR